MKKEGIFIIFLFVVIATCFSAKAQEVTNDVTTLDSKFIKSQFSFIADGNWNDGSNWNTGKVPPSGSDVIITANAIIPSDYTAVANEVSLEDGSITVADGGQLRHNTEGLVVTMKKNIIPYSVMNGTCNYYLLGFPFSENVAVPDIMTAAEGNDFYGFDPNYLYAEWRNNKEQAITTIGGTTGFLYSNPEAIELSLTGSTCPSFNEEVIELIVSYTEGSSNIFNGWCLLGNPYTCNAYIYYHNIDDEPVPMEFKVYNENGELVTVSGGPIAPMQGFFVNVTETTTVYIRNYASPMGTINGKFTINADGNQVYFSQGNLQYIGSAAIPYWKFADNQWDVLGTITGQNSANANVDRDLFGWGTSGWNPGNTYFHPWDTYNLSGSSYGPSGSHNLTGDYANSDWGIYNPIFNGGGQSNQWRTLTKEEWKYVTDSRTTASGIRFAKAIVNDMNGVILLPDDWNSSFYDLNETNVKEASYTCNTITVSEWYLLEQHGAVFLPAAGFRFGTSVSKAGENCYYWSSSYVNGNYAYGMYVNESTVNPADCSNRTYGRSVRLVQMVD